MLFRDLMKQDLPEELKTAAAELLEIKRQTPEGELMPRIPAISDFIEAEIKAQQEMLSQIPDNRNRDIASLNRFFQETVLV